MNPPGSAPAGGNDDKTVIAKPYEKRDMILRRPFLLTKTSLKELEQHGLSNDLLSVLSPMKDKKFQNSRELLQTINDRSAHPTTKVEQKLILKMTRQSLLRLERIIPNRNIREWGDALIFAVIVAVIVRTFLFAPFKIPSGSMVPTIEIGDHIFASMFSYGIPIPFTGTKLFPQEIKRGEIVIFPYPLEPSVDYIKRVIAKGGDTLEIKGETVFINGEPREEPYAYFDPVILDQMRANGSQPRRFGPIKIPQGKLFMMGDNRFNSSDSRVWGFVDASSVRGKGQVIYWSHDPKKTLVSGYRLERIGSFLK